MFGLLSSGKPPSCCLLVRALIGKRAQEPSVAAGGFCFSVTRRFSIRRDPCGTERAYCFTAAPHIDGWRDHACPLPFRFTLVQCFRPVSVVPDDGPVPPLHPLAATRAVPGPAMAGPASSPVPTPQGRGPDQQQQGGGGDRLRRRLGACRVRGRPDRKVDNVVVPQAPPAPG